MTSTFPVVDQHLTDEAIDQRRAFWFADEKCLVIGVKMVDDSGIQFATQDTSASMIA